MQERIIGHYKILGELARGGQGVIYRALDLNLDREVALKRPLDEHIADSSSMQRFLREARITSRIEHPNIVPIFEVLEEDGVPWIAMQLIEGSSLRDRMEGGEPLAIPSILRHSVELSSALEAAHKKGVLHRDINPNNVILGEDGRALLADFGLGRFFVKPEEMSSASTESSEITSPGSVLGTPGYMAPEQVLGKETDVRSDIFSLGAVIYEMCTGKAAFRRESPGDSLNAVLNEAPTAMLRLNYSVPGRLDAIVRKAIRKRPEERYQSVLELRTDLETLRRREESGAAAPSPAPVPRRRRVLGLLGIPALLVAAALVYWLLPGGGSGPPPTTVPVAQAAPRPRVAVLPPEDATGHVGSDLQVRMLADLLAADLGESSTVQAVPTRRVAEIVGGSLPGSGRDDLRDRVVNLASAAWVVDGVLYKEDPQYQLKIDLYKRDAAEPETSFRVEAATTGALVDLATARLRRATAGGEEGGGFDPTTEQLAPASEEARLLEFEGREHLQAARYQQAIARFEEAAEMEPAFLMAQVGLALALDRAGYGRRAEEAAARAVRLLDTHQVDAVPRQELLARAAQAEILDDFDREAEYRGELNERYPGEPELLLALARAMGNSVQREPALAFIARARAIDPADPWAPLRRARLLVNMKRAAEAMADLDEAEALFAAVPSVAGRGEVALSRGYALYKLGRYDEARDAYRNAAELFDEAGLEVRVAGAVKSQADMEMKQGRLSAARVLYDQAIPVARKAGDHRLIVTILGGLGAQLYGQGDLVAAQDVLREAVDEARQLNNPRVILSPLINLAGLLNYTGNVGEGRALAGEALEAARERQDLLRQRMALSLMADADYQQGRLDEAVQIYRDLIELAAADGEPGESMEIAQAALAAILVIRGYTQEALTAANEAIALERQLNKTLQLGYTLTVRGDIYGQLADWEQAERDLDEAHAIAADEANPLPDLEGRVSLARGALYLRQERWERAAEFLEAARREGEKGGAIGLEVPALTWLCRLALARGDAEAAVAAARKAVDHDKALADERTAARAALAEALAAAGQTRAAASEGRRALEEAERMGLPLRAAHAAAAASSIGGADQPADRDGLRRRGRQALEQYVLKAPEQDRARLRGRPDLAPLFRHYEMEAAAKAAGGK